MMIYIKQPIILNYFSYICATLSSFSQIPDHYYSTLPVASLKDLFTILTLLYQILSCVGDNTEKNIL
ncbi:hypothetical protein XELAEV_18004724mg [Xenopus laevis]|uniref:Uncharacterized protein n=1 Tax=Xenopus laevis TaxID=8355 RepID=A0A974GZG5_XENLA|nr:hypothetical protein XELAEV_18004724mg [Xenopus laevis]